MIKAVIFDMDGVLVDSETITFKATKQALKEIGIDLKKEDYFPLMGYSSDDMFAKMKEQFGLQVGREEFLARRRELDKQDILENGIDSMPQAIETIEALKEKGLKLALASSSTAQSIKFKLSQLGLTNAFDAIVSRDEVVESKPNPEIFLIAAQKINLNPEKCVVIEDAVQGIQAAQKAGMKCIALQSEHNQALDLTQANEIVTNLSQVKEVIEKWNGEAQ